MQNGARTIEYIRQQVTFCFLPGPYTPCVHRPVTFCVCCLINHFSRPSLLTLLSSCSRLSPLPPTPLSPPPLFVLPPRLLFSPFPSSALFSLPPCRFLLPPTLPLSSASLSPM